MTPSVTLQLPNSNIFSNLLPLSFKQSNCCTVFQIKSIILTLLRHIYGTQMVTNILEHSPNLP